MKGNDSELFPGMTFSNLMEDIYKTSKTKRAEIQKIIKTIDAMVNDVNDAVMLGPVLQGFMDTSVKNDDQLVKMAQIVQRLISNDIKEKSGGDPSELLSEEEKEALIQSAVDDLRIMKSAVDDDIDNLTKKKSKKLNEK